MREFAQVVGVEQVGLRSAARRTAGRARRRRGSAGRRGRRHQFGQGAAGGHLQRGLPQVGQPRLERACSAAASGGAADARRAAAPRLPVRCDVRHQSAHACCASRHWPASSDQRGRIARMPSCAAMDREAIRTCRRYHLTSRHRLALRVGVMARLSDPRTRRVAVRGTWCASRAALSARARSGSPR